MKHVPAVSTRMFVPPSLLKVRSLRAFVTAELFLAFSLLTAAAEIALLERFVCLLLGRFMGR